MAFWTSRTRRNTTRTCAVDTRRPPSSYTMASMMLTSMSMVAPRASSTSPSGATGEIAARLPPSLRAIAIPRDAGALYREPASDASRDDDGARSARNPRGTSYMSSAIDIPRLGPLRTSCRSRRRALVGSATKPY